MRGLIRIQDAIVLLEMLLTSRLRDAERVSIGAALADLRLAQVSPDARAEMHRPMWRRHYPPSRVFSLAAQDEMARNKAKK